MSVDDRDRSTGFVESAAATQRQDDIWVKSYRYLRTAMAILMIGLGAAVFYQTWRQGFHVLASVSAYYYTPAQAILVGALISLGACMIALEGTNMVEEVFLDLGGMFAAVVAIVPTSRGADYETAVRACREAAGPLMTQRASPDLDCPTVLALADATRANVTNNVFALLVMGVLSLVAAALFALRDARNAAGSASGPRPGFWWGMGAASAVWIVGLIVFSTSVESVVEYGHYVGAWGLLTCIIVVALANAVRQDEKRRTGDPGPKQMSGGILNRRPNRYDWIACALVVVAVVGAVLVFVNAFALFWLEIAVALLFAVFWVVQTVEQLPEQPAGRI